MKWTRKSRRRCTSVLLEASLSKSNANLNTAINFDDSDAVGGTQHVPREMTESHGRDEATIDAMQQEERAAGVVEWQAIKCIRLLTLGFSMSAAARGFCQPGRS